MNTPLSDRTSEDIAQEIIKPLEESLAREDELLKKVDERIHELEQKAKAFLVPAKRQDEIDARD